MKDSKVARLLAELDEVVGAAEAEVAREWEAYRRLEAALGAVAS